MTPAEIKSRRLALGMTQGDLADAIRKRVPGSLCRIMTVSRWERGAKSPSSIYALALKKVLG